MLGSCSTSCAALLEPDALGADDPVRRRLYPDGYADPTTALADSAS